MMRSARDDRSDRPPPDPLIVSTRTFQAPRSAVFQAFTDAGTLSRWWGPAGFTNTFHEFDPRPGGAWRFAMHAPDGTTFDLEKRFLELVPEKRIVLQHVDPVHGFRMEMTFGDEGESTRLVWRMRFERPEEAERVRAAVLEANEQNFDRLAAELAGDADAEAAPARQPAPHPAPRGTARGPRARGGGGGGALGGARR